jgi:hypothetical protein
MTRIFEKSKILPADSIKTIHLIAVDKSRISFQAATKILLRAHVTWSRFCQRGISPPQMIQGGYFIKEAMMFYSH